MEFIFGLCVAFLGALLVAAGSELQSRSVHASNGRWSIFVKNPRWALGLVLLGTAVMTNFLALAWAPVSAVQAIGVVALACSAAHGVLARRVVFHHRTGLSILACLVGALGFVTMIATHPGHVAQQHLEQQLVTVMVIQIALTVLSTVMVYATSGSSHKGRCLLGLTVGAMGFGGITAVFKVLVELVLRDGLLVVLLQPLTLTALIAIALGGGLAWVHLQRAHSVLPTPTVIAGLTITDTLTVAVIGILILGETALSPADALVLLGFGALAITGVIGLRDLARSSPPLTHSPARTAI